MRIIKPLDNSPCSSNGGKIYYHRHYKHNFHFVKTLKPSYYELRQAWASMMIEMLDAFTWSWWVTLTSKEHISLKSIRKRFYRWLKTLRKARHGHFEVIWVLERQRRGVLHVHAVISNMPLNNMKFWKAMINVWEYGWYGWYGKSDEKFGSATIIKYDPLKAGELANYLAKERSKDLSIVEGNGSLFEKFGFSRGVKRYLDTPLLLRKLL